MTERHVVVGAGPVGRTVAELLAGRGDEVVLASRSGSGPALPGVRRESADAADADALTRLADGATVLYNCLNPPSYTAWPTDWPPMAAALLTAAERSGAVLATAANLYAYGRVEAPMVEGMPDAATGTKGRVRAGMTADAFAAHEAGRLRAVEVRASDYLGAGPGGYAHIPRVVGRAREGKTAWVFGRTDQPHTWTDVRDTARALVSVAAESSAWGRVWHAPSNPPTTQAEAVRDVCRSVGAEPGPVRAMPHALLAVLAPLVPLLRELRETEYQFDRPFVMDSGAITAAFGLEPTPWDEVCRRTAG